MSHLVVLPACSLLGAQMELLPRIFFSAWSVFLYHMVITMLLHVCTLSSEGLEHMTIVLNLLVIKMFFYSTIK